MRFYFSTFSQAPLNNDKSCCSFMSLSPNTSKEVWLIGGCKIEILLYFLVYFFQAPLNDDKVLFLHGSYTRLVQRGLLNRGPDNQVVILFIQAPLNDDKACCSFMGLTPDSSKAHLMRAILESLAFRFKLLYETVLHETKTPLSKLIK